MKFYVIEFPRGLDFSNEVRQMLMDPKGMNLLLLWLVSTYQQYLRILPPSDTEYDVSPQQYHRRQNNYMLSVGTNGTAQLRLARRDPDASKDSKKEKLIHLPDETTVIPIIGTNTSGDLALWSIIFGMKDVVWNNPIYS